MLQKAKSSRRTPGGGDKAWASEAAVEGVKRLRQQVVTVLRAMLVALRQEDIETLTTLLLKLQEKVCSMPSSLTSKEFTVLKFYYCRLLLQSACA